MCFSNAALGLLLDDVIHTMYRVVFFLFLPNFSTKKKIANQPITAAVPVNLVNKKGCDWLIGGFLFGTENGWEQLKSPPCISKQYIIINNGP